jgi:hypothetical protein
MKKIIFGIAFGLVLVSCDKEKVETVPVQATLNMPEFVDAPEQKLTPIETDKISIENGVLAFETIEFYQSIVDFEDYSKITFTIKYLNSLGEFHSFGEVNPESQIFDSEFMNVIVNADMVVKIGEWFIRVNPMTEKVYVSNVNSENAYDLVVNESENNVSVLIFDTHQNVLEILQGDGVAQNKAGCGEDAADTRHVEGGFGGPASSTNKLRLEHRSYGILFEIQSKCYSPLPANQYFWVTYTTYKQYEKKCESLVTMPLGTVWSSLNNGSWINQLVGGSTNFYEYSVYVSAAGRCTLLPNGTLSYDANILGPLWLYANQ